MKLFISYAREDKATIRQLVEVLRESGQEPWFDNDLLPGTEWRPELLQTIADCDVFVYALSPDSLESIWCQREFEAALNLKKPIIPVRLFKGLEPPEALNAYQHGDISDGLTPQAIAKLLGGLTNVAVSRSAPVPRRNRRRWVVIGVVIALLFVVGVVAATQLQNQPPAQVTCSPEFGVSEYMVQAEQQLGERSYENAYRLYSCVIALDSDNALAFNNRGAALLQLGRHDQAIADFNRAANLDEDYTDAFFNLALTYRRMGDNERAIDYYTNVIELDDDYVNAYNNRGNIYLELGDYDSAESDMLRTAELQPQNQNAQFVLGEIYYERGDTQTALAYYRRYIEIAGENAAPEVLQRVQELTRE